jgi:hypothetical protein
MGNVVREDDRERGRKDERGGDEGGLNRGWVR